MPGCGRRRPEKVREFVTPEGVDLQLRIAGAGLRLARTDRRPCLHYPRVDRLQPADALDRGRDARRCRRGHLDARRLLLRTFWFIGFELGARAATPGKRLMGIRVVARDGGRLTADAVVARNLSANWNCSCPS